LFVIAQRLKPTYIDLVDGDKPAKNDCRRQDPTPSKKKTSSGEKSRQESGSLNDDHASRFIMMK
jgi:hypothetical protein